MNDLISRQAAIEAVGDVPYIKEHPNVGLLWKAWIESLPSAQPEQRWIPCSEKLPDIGELVLITQNRGDGDKTVETAYLTSDGPNDLYWSIELFKSRETDVVLAWMPLPEPYRRQVVRSNVL